MSNLVRKLTVRNGVIALLVIIGIVVLRSRLSAVPTNQFELDGNAVSNGFDDWVSSTYVGGSVAQSFIADGSGNATIFTGGGSKDINDVSNWAWKDNAGGLPDKDNITNAYARAYFDSVTGLTIYFGADRFANDGDAQMGFWFFQNKVTVNANGTFNGTHVVGDILVLANLTNGGATVTIQVYKWVGGKDPLLLLASDLNAKCGSNPDPNACAISNADPETAPWAYTPKSGPSGTFPTFSFIEGGINVTALLGGQSECFSSFLAETRSSQSPTATLKDFALGGFETCKLEISKTCDTAAFNPTTLQVDYTYNVTVKNSGLAPIYDVTVVDTADLYTTNGIEYSKTFTLATLAVGASQSFSATFGITPGPTAINPPTNNASVTAALSPGGAQTLSAGPATATCPSVSFSGDITVSKICSSRLEVQNNRVVVAVDISGQVCSTAAQSPIDNVTVTDSPAIQANCNPSGGGCPPTISLGTLSPAQCKDYSATYFPNAVIGPGLPHDQSYTDTVTATGTLRFTNASLVQSISATCPLCP